MRRSMVWSLQQLERAIERQRRSQAAPGASSIQPREIYLSEITNALTDAILDYTESPIGVGADEWLTVAARESVDRRFVPADPNDTAMTIILRIKGSDLNALRDRKLGREEARKRVEVKQYEPGTRNPESRSPESLDPVSNMGMSRASEACSCFS